MRQKRMSKENTDLRAEIDRLHTWAGLMSLLAEHYPPEVFDGSSSDPGSMVVRLTRQLDSLRRGEFMCAKCGLRKDSEHSGGPEF